MPSGCLSSPAWASAPIASARQALNDDVGFADAPLQLQIGPELGSAHRGAVVVWCVSTIVGVLAAFTLRIMSSASSETLLSAAARLRLPGLLFVAISLLLQQTIVSSVMLVSGVSDEGWGVRDALVGCIGLLATVCVVAPVAVVLDPRAARFRAVVTSDAPKASKPVKVTTCKKRFVLCLRWLTQAETEWQPR